jgi:hypothetical protein
VIRFRRCRGFAADLDAIEAEAEKLRGEPKTAAAVAIV